VEEGGTHPNGTGQLKGGGGGFGGDVPGDAAALVVLVVSGGVLRWKRSDRNEEMTTNRRESKCGRSSLRWKKNCGDGFNPGSSDGSPANGFGQ
jgi:hypothetical protein